MPGKWESLWCRDLPSGHPLERGFAVPPRRRQWHVKMAVEVKFWVGCGSAPKEYWGPRVVQCSFKHTVYTVYIIVYKIYKPDWDSEWSEKHLGMLECVCVTCLKTQKENVAIDMTIYHCFAFRQHSLFSCFLESRLISPPFSDWHRYLIRSFQVDSQVTDLLNVSVLEIEWSKAWLARFYVVNLLDGELSLDNL